MRRSDRLFELSQLLRDGRFHRAADLAARLGVTERTVYRDMDTLMTSGLPIAGARGYGYRLTAPVTLPPLNLSLTELEALHLGLAVVGEAGDEDQQTAAKSLSAKIDAALPEDRSNPPTGWGYATYPFADAAKGFRHMPQIRAAIQTRQKLRITYPDANGAKADQRTIRPLRRDYWGRHWTLIAWCETASDFEVFRVDKIARLTVLPGLFVDEPGKTLADYLDRSAEPQGEQL